MERCPYCLEDLTHGSEHCPHCEEPLTGEAEARLASPARVQRERDLLAASTRADNALWYGIVGLLLLPFCFGVAVAIGAIVEGLIARQRFRRLGEPVPTRVVIGMVLGGIGLGIVGCVIASAMP